MNTCKQQSIILFHDGGPCVIETSPLICTGNQWTSFCIVGTTVMEDSRRYSSTYIESLSLHVVKHNLLLFFFYPTFSLSPFYHFHRLHGHLKISWVIAAESAPLCIAGSRNRIWNLHDLQNSLFLKLHCQPLLLGKCLKLGQYQEIFLLSYEI